MGHEQLHPGLKDISPRSELSLTASQLFTNASNDFPASVTAQAAFMTQRMREQRIAPSAIQLGKALLADTDGVNRILEAGNSRHRRAGRTFIISEEDMRRTVKLDFGYGELMSVLKHDDLSELIGLYTQMVTPGEPHFHVEAYIKSQALFIINQRRREQGLPARLTRPSALKAIELFFH